MPKIPFYFERFILIKTRQASVDGASSLLKSEMQNFARRAWEVEVMVRGLRRRIESVVVVGAGVAGMTATAAIQEVRRGGASQGRAPLVRSLVTLEALPQDQLLSPSSGQHMILHAATCTALWRSLCLHEELSRTLPHFHPGWLRSSGDPGKGITRLFSSAPSPSPSNRLLCVDRKMLLSWLLSVSSRPQSEDSNDSLIPSSSSSSFSSSSSSSSSSPVLFNH